MSAGSDDATPMTGEDAVAAGRWLLGMVASAEHASDADGGVSYGADALEGLQALSHDGQHWLAQVLAAACWQLGATIAREHDEPLPPPQQVRLLQHVIEHIGSVVTL